MTRAVRSLVVDDEGLQALLEPRTFPAVERRTGDDTPGSVTFDCARGPYDRYVRRVEHGPGDEDGLHRVEHSVDYDIAIPFWAPLYRPFVTRVALSPTPVRRAPWWAPPELFDAEASRLVAVACVLAVATGWSQAALGASLPLVRVDFQATTSTIAGILAGIRIAGLAGALLLFVVPPRNRARSAALLAGIAVASTVLSGFAPSLGALAGTQAVAGLVTAASLVMLPILVVDALPHGARAYGAQLLLLAGGVGAAGPTIGFLLGDISPSAWRLSYLGAVVLAPSLWFAVRHLPAHPPPAPTPVADADDGAQDKPWRLGAVMFLNGAFAAPAFSLLTDHLRNARGLSSGEVTVFLAVTSIPAIVTFVAAGRMGLRVEHRHLLAVGLFGGGACLVGIYLFDGPAMWAAATASFTLFGLAAPVGVVFGPSSFPTASRGRAVAVLNGLAVAGGAAGLAVTSAMSSQNYSVATSLICLGLLSGVVGLPLLMSVTLPSRPAPA